jgi:hypothetical protein
MFTKEAQAARHKEFQHLFVCFLAIIMHKGTAFLLKNAFFSLKIWWFY